MSGSHSFTSLSLHQRLQPILESALWHQRFVMKFIHFAGATLASTALLALPGRALDLTNGVMQAVPTKNAQPPKIDGDLSDFDLSASEPIVLAEQTARSYNADVALNYDDAALYIAARVALPNRRIHNPNSPVDAFWGGDVLELRVAADPTLPKPLNNSVQSDRVAHLTMWRNSETGQDFLFVAYGVNIDKGSQANPSGTQIVIKEHGTSHYTLEARVPWSVLHAPGGTNPFQPGQSMTAVWSPHWGGERQVAALYRQNPGTFAFNQPGSWGEVEFSAKGNLPPRHENLQQLLARFEAQLKAPQAAQVGVPITLQVLAPSKVSVNILGPRGEVVRELAGGEARPKGPWTLKWDGKDQWGRAMKPGRYRWGAYLSNGLKPRFVAGVGKTAAPYYDTVDGRGGWGADHSNPIDVAADASGMYFLWPVAEAGRALVKTDYAGRVLWRKTPFLGGGWGPFHALASDGKFIYLARGESKPGLARVDARTGQLQTWNSQAGAPSELPISDSEAIEVPNASSPLSSSEAFGAKASGKQPETVGLAVRAGEVFAPVYSKNIVQVLDASTGKPSRTLACPGPRGVCVDASGNLFVVSYVAGQTPSILKFEGARGEGRAVVSKYLVAPWDVAVDNIGRVIVSDGGASQQIKIIATGAVAGQVLRTLGRAGGRAWAGKYDSNSFLNPAGVAIDAQGALLVAESAIPKVMSRWNVSTGQAIKRWFGAPIYWNGTWPEPNDPRTVYYQLNGGFARANLARPDTPQAYWSLSAAGMPDAGNFESVIPTVQVLANGRKYLVGDVSPSGIALMQGDQVLPVAHFLVKNAARDAALGARNTSDRNFIEVWQDQNGDHREQPEEVTRLDSIQGKPLPFVADWFTHVSYVAPNGDFYVITQGNSIIKIPAAGFNPDGSIRWNVAGASYAVPFIFPSQGAGSFAGPRGHVGLRLNARGEIYTATTQNLPEPSPELEAKLKAEYPNVLPLHWGLYASKELHRSMREGLGHTGESNAVKFVKFAPDGRVLWMAGRKATAAAKAGEMYHFWSLAGLIGPPGREYVAGASEWGPITFYTHDGFFVDSIMNNPGLSQEPGPYSFGSETGSGRVQYFPKQDQVWAYAVGQAYVVDGFKNGQVLGEKRVYGNVQLDRVYEAEATAQQQATPLQIVRAQSNPLADASVWQGVPTSTLRRNESELATAQLAYDDANLYGRIHVNDDTPSQNSADTVATAFKGGDTAGIVLGPSGARDAAGLGDVRLMVAKVNGQPKLIAMKMVSNQAKQPFEYFTPSAGRVSFDFVGEVPGGQVALVPDADGAGYTATFAVPRAFLELDLKPGSTLSGDVEVRLSGQGQRGLQATSRNYLFTPQRSETSMTDDVPTESRLYPQYFGRVEVK